MQRQRSLWESSAAEGTAPVWTRLDGEQRAEVVAVLARVLAKASTRSSEAAATAVEEETDDE